MTRFLQYLILILVLYSCKQHNPQEEKLNKGYSIVDLYKKPISKWPKPIIDEGVEWQEMKPIEINYNYFEDIKKPEVTLGKLLFFDPKLSSSNQISCSSCHHPEMGWATHTEKSTGHNHLQSSRNAPTILNVASKKIFFWDGRVASLENQALGPITAHNEMNMNIDELPGKLQKVKRYEELFKKVYKKENITIEQVLSAIAAFERTIKSQPSKVDRFMKGSYKALTDSEIKGLHLFRTKARCMNCHHGQFFTDQKFHNIGLTYYKREQEDLGRYNVTKNSEDVGKFLTPSLRDLLNTRPWMHNGFFDNLTGVVNMYNSGMQMLNPSFEEKKKDSLFPVVDPLMKPLNLTDEEINDLVAFLKALNGTKYKMEIPEVPR